MTIRNRKSQKIYFYTRYFPPGEFILLKQQETRSLYILLEGTVLDANGIIQDQESVGSYFGVSSLFGKKYSRAHRTLISNSCRVLCLRRSDIYRVFSSFGHLLSLGRDHQISSITLDPYLKAVLSSSSMSTQKKNEDCESPETSKELQGKEYDSARKEKERTAAVIGG